MGIKIIFAGSAGGHITELFAIFDKSVIGDNQVIVFTESNQRTRKLKNKTYFFKNPKYNPFPYIPMLFKCIRIFKKEKPDLLITNGAEVGLPAIIAAKLLRIKTIYLDISAAATIRTLAGKLSYPFADVFLVQYPNMIKHYGKKAKYIGGIV